MTRQNCGWNWKLFTCIPQFVVSFQVVWHYRFNGSLLPPIFTAAKCHCFDNVVWNREWYLRPRTPNGTSQEPGCEDCIWLMLSVVVDRWIIFDSDSGCAGHMRFKFQSCSWSSHCQDVQTKNSLGCQQKLPSVSYWQHCSLASPLISPKSYPLLLEWSALVYVVQAWRSIYHNNCYKIPEVIFGSVGHLSQVMVPFVSVSVFCCFYYYSKGQASVRLSQTTLFCNSSSALVSSVSWLWLAHAPAEYVAGTQCQLPFGFDSGT